ncbi:hypothetical protein AA11825_0579 [Acetobacter pomorum DSM 11825]|nr:hypothetical protein AA11825_0579 [Acetobacter pomorum DSM 11825]
MFMRMGAMPQIGAGNKGGKTFNTVDETVFKQKIQRPIDCRRSRTPPRRFKLFQQIIGTNRVRMGKNKA